MIDKLEAISHFLTGKLWWMGQEQGFRVMGVNIKITPGGMLGVVKAFTAEGPKVLFINAPDLEHLYRELQHLDEAGNNRWKEDKFALDRMGT